MRDLLLFSACAKPSSIKSSTAATYGVGTTAVADKGNRNETPSALKDGRP